MPRKPKNAFKYGFTTSLAKRTIRATGFFSINIMAPMVRPVKTPSKDIADELLYINGKDYLVMNPILV